VKQIPFGNDNQKSKGNNKGKSTPPFRRKRERMGHPYAIQFVS
jgi:hypothetical protein